MTRNHEIEKEIELALGKLFSSLEYENGRYKLTTKNENKSVIVEWSSPIFEVDFTFIENQKIIESGALEFFDRESPEESAKSIKQVASRFLKLPWRLQKHGKLFKRTELEVNTGNHWESVYD